jgi:uncharacterized membrane protein
MHHFSLAIGLLLTITATALAQPNWCGYTFTQIGVPNTRGDVSATSLNGISSQQWIIGGFRDSNPPQGYLLKGGLFRETVNVPGSQSTIARDINDVGDVVGGTLIGSGPTAQWQAFYRDKDGHYTTFGVPGASLTDAWSISNDGRIVGEYRDAAGQRHGFFWDGGPFRPIDAPLAARTLLFGVNAMHDVIGTAIDTSGRTLYSFLLSNDVFQRVDVPGAFTTGVDDINDRGQIVGRYIETDPSASPTFATRSFVLENGTFTLIDAPFPNTYSTEVAGINDKGELVGSVLFADFRATGFAAVPRACTPR